jgi:hypothetical protein
MNSHRNQLKTDKAKKRKKFCCALLFEITIMHCITRKILNVFTMKN